MVNIRMAHVDNHLAHHFMTIMRCNNLMGLWCLALPSI